MPRYLMVMGHFYFITLALPEKTMQVTHVSDHSTHAVIGGKQTIELGVSNSAEFTHILSSTLYTNQKLAVIREVLCNAWDAHIMGNCTDRPVEILLNNQELIIRDFGPGIHPDMIGPIYGVYGNSTKKNDGKQTGGFGLGSKAPFAYTDMFEVTSCHEGVKTIYTMSKVAPGAGGKSGITPLVQVQTQEHGLTVKIKLKTPHDQKAFAALIKEVIFRGEIFATLNGDKLDTMPLSKTKEGWALISGLDSHPILVRYGNVIYPVPLHEDYGTYYNEIQNNLTTLNIRNTEGSYSLVFMAPSHSISVTPSREALSLQPHTIQTLKVLLENIAKLLVTCNKPNQTEYLRPFVQKLLTTKDITSLLHRSSNYINIEQHTRDPFIARRGILKKNFSLAKLRYINSIPLKLFIEERVKSGELVKHLAYPMIRAMMQPSDYDKRPLRKWIYQELLQPLARGMEAKGLDPKSWRIHAPNESALHTPRELFFGRNQVYDRQLISLANSIVVLSHTPRSSPLTYDRYRDFKEYGNDELKALQEATVLVYVVKSRKKEDVQAAIDHLTPRVRKVINLVPELQPVVRTPRTKGTVAKPKTEGYVPLSYGLIGPSTHQSVDFMAVRRAMANRITNPACWILGKDVSGTNTLSGYYNSTAALLKLFGDKCAVVTQPQADKLKAAGLPQWDEYVEQAILGEISNNPKYLEWYSFDDAVYDFGNHNHSNLLKILETLPKVRKEFQLQDAPVLSDREKLFWQIWENQLERPYVTAYKPLIDTFKKTKPNVARQAFIARVDNHPGLHVFSSYQLKMALEGHYDGKTKKPSKHLLEALINILKET